MPHLAVAIAAPTTAAARAALHQAAGRADLAELRLDLMDEFDLPALLAGRPLPVIVTCRPQREGGRWQGDEAERLAVLRQAAVLGADYVDLEWDAAGEIASLDRSRTGVILSRHDFAAMPDDLAAQAGRLWQAGPDAVKLVGMAHGLADCTPVLRLLAGATRPTIAIAMGEHGLISRLLAFRYRHALLSFAAPDPPASAAAAAGTAPGQITLSAMRQVYRVQAIDPRTAFIGLLAPDAALSPVLADGNRWLGDAGCNVVLIPLSSAPSEDPAAALAAIKPAAGLLGCILPTPDGLVVLSSNEGRGAIGAERETGDASADLSMTSSQFRSGGSDRQPTSAPDSHPVILSGFVQQPSPARYSSEESPLPAALAFLWPRRAHADTIVDALGCLLGGAPGATPDG